LTPLSLCSHSVPPKIVPFSFGEEPSNFGDSAFVHCSVSSGDSPINLNWYFDGGLVTHADKLRGISTMMMGKKVIALSIDPIKANHAGNYTCAATNQAATTSFSTQLIVNGKGMMIIMSSLKLLFFSFSPLPILQCFSSKSHGLTPCSASQNCPLRIWRRTVEFWRFCVCAVQRFVRRLAD
jgi:Immunoglobulin domain